MGGSFVQIVMRGEGGIKTRERECVMQRLERNERQ